MAIKVPREYIPGEARYVTEFIQEFYPGKRFRVPFRMGIHPLVKDEDLAAFPDLYSWKGTWADADGCVWWDHQAVIIEGKLRTGTFGAGLGALETYELLWPMTPILREQDTDRVTLVLVTPVESPLISLKCYRKGYQNVIWKPVWYDKFVKRYPAAYKTVSEVEVRLAQLLEGKLKPPTITH